MSDSHRRRILRRVDTAAASSAALLVDLPGGPARPGVNTLQEMVEAARAAGREEGYRAATEELAAAEATGRAAQLRRVADALVGAAAVAGPARAEAIRVAADEAVELACELAEAILQRELLAGDGIVEALIRAVALVPDEDDLVVRLHPSDSITADELSMLIPNAKVRVIPDARVEAGGCVVNAGPCRIDAQVGSALERARRVLDELYPDRSQPRSMSTVGEVA